MFGSINPTGSVGGINYYCPHPPADRPSRTTLSCHTRVYHIPQNLLVKGSSHLTPPIANSPIQQLLQRKPANHKFFQTQAIDSLACPRQKTQGVPHPPPPEGDPAAKLLFLGL